MAAEAKLLKMDQIVLGDTQIRCRISSKTVDSYAEQIKEGIEFLPIDVFLDTDGRYLLGDGYHRYMASQQNGSEKVRVLVHECKPEEAASRALELSILQNAKHGLLLTREDRRNAVKKLLSDPMFKKKNDSPIAKMVGVSSSTVSDVRREMAGDAKKKKRDVEVGGHKRSAPSEKAAEPDSDPLQERVNTLRGWVDSGLIEWADIQSIFSTTSHFPILVPRKPHHVVLIRDGKQAKVWVDKLAPGKSGDEAVLVLHGINKTEAVEKSA